MNKSSLKASRKRMKGRAAGRWNFRTRVAKQEGAKIMRDLLLGALKRAEET